ncbi:hypothetical protein HETIRDRAFT_426147 [Heterobasidion irregulare TC 32-1]|uniref:Uncharacterized protein n=1 Tax=Heterobasidion irregulare (strain TC 32-1) TaxID=747525 RepID=W4KBN7_HETIT|nr:uncharacterized protein HETIRDRAFT_426147 [Heterobasidion irregulare TC 32-1]ETW82481.1 hypothetical protein HETIRDRAFT_426147 [Heterobasidion irregulare TC 32-1]
MPNNVQARHRLSLDSQQKMMKIRRGIILTSAQVPEEPSDEAVDEQGGAEDNDSEEEYEEEKGEEGPLMEEEEDSDDDLDPLPKGDGRERDERVLAEEGYGKF